MRRRNGSTWLALLALAVASASLALNLSRPGAWPFGGEPEELMVPDPGSLGLRPIAELPPPPGAAPPVEAPDPPVVEVVPEPDVKELARPLVESIAARLRRAEQAEARLEDQRAAIARAEVAVETANLGLGLARLSLRDFRFGHYPQLRSEAETDLTLKANQVQWQRQKISWSKVLAGRGVGDENSIAIEQRNLKMAESELEAARQQLKGLVEETVPRQVAELEERIAQAEAARRTHAADLEHQRALGLRRKQERDAEAISPREREAILGLDEALRLVAAGREADARSRLDEAAAAWRVEQDRRAALDRADDRRRFDEAAERFRTAGDEPAGPH